METLNSIWQAIVPYFAGVSIAGIISAIIYGCLRGAFNRTISKINVKEIADEATEKGVEKVKKITFNHSIQPIVESELKKIDEHAAELLKAEFQAVNDNYERLILVLEKLAAYFDNSIGVSEQAKAELKAAIEAAKTEPVTAESVIIDEQPEEKVTPSVEPVKEEKKASAEIVR